MEICQNWQFWYDKRILISVKMTQNVGFGKTFLVQRPERSKMESAIIRDVWTQMQRTRLQVKLP
jgi:hypothetical protein